MQPLYTRCTNNMVREMEKFLPVIDISCDSYFNAQDFVYVRKPSDLEARAFGKSTITVQAHGSVPFFDDPAMDHSIQPCYDHQTGTIEAYVAGIDKDGLAIIIDDDIQDGLLVDPARLSLTHIINFRLDKITVLDSIQQ